MFLWCRETESNCRHEALQAPALPLSYPGLALKRSEFEIYRIMSSCFVHRTFLYDITSTLDMHRYIIKF